MRRVLGFLLFASLAAPPVLAPAGEIAALMPGATTGVMPALAKAFEAKTGYVVRARFDLINRIAARIKAGESVDIALETPAAWEALAVDGLVDRTIRREVATIDWAMYVRRGHRRLDVGSVEAVKATLLAAQSISYPTVRGPIRAYQDTLMADLGLTDALRPKLVAGREPRPGEVGVTFEVVEQGAAELGFGTVPEILARPGLELLAPLPPELRRPIVFVTVLPVKQVNGAARQFAEFLVSDEGRAILRSGSLAPN